VSEQAPLRHDRTAPGCDCGGVGICPACLREDLRIAQWDANAARVDCDERVAVATMDLRRERNQWKANHDAQVAKKRALQGKFERLRAAAKLVLEADMLGVRDIDALNALEAAAGFRQQGDERDA
jgi:hypothetical protein